MGLGIKTAILKRLKPARYTAASAPIIRRTYHNWAKVLAFSTFGFSPKKIALRNGLVIKCAPNSEVVSLVKDIFIDGVYESGPVKIDAEDIIVDIGANIGIFALYAASRTRQSIYAFEAFPDNYRLLQQNAAHNGFTNIQCYPLAVYDQKGIASMRVNRSGGGHTMSERKGRNATDQIIRLNTVSLHDIFVDNGLERIDFLKLDCEGSEYPILRAAQPADLARIRKIAMEYHDFDGNHYKQLESLLETAGFTTETHPVGDGGGYLYARNRNC